MKNVLFFAFTLYSLHAFPQYFTTGSVYDYSVGDTIVTSKIKFTIEGSYVESPPEYDYHVYIGKKFSSNGDTITYKRFNVNVKQEVVAYPVFTLVITTTTYLDSFKVFNLMDTIIKFTFPGAPCVKTLDNTFINSCGYYAHSKIWKWRNDTSCPSIEIPKDERLYVEGIGEFRHMLTYSTLPRGGYKTALVSAHKVGKVSCGKVGAIPTEIREQPYENNKPKFYPNPNNGVFEIESYNNAIIMVMDMYGKEVLKKEVVQGKTIIDLQSHPEGVYFVIVTSDKTMCSSKLVKQ